MELLVEIYGLFCPETGRLRYVGKAKDSAKRFKGHLREIRRRTPLYDWIKSLRQRDLMPAMRILSRVPESEWMAEEKRLIFESRLTTNGLLNLADGGDQPKCPTEIRAANGKATSKRIHEDPFLHKIWMYKRAVGSALRYGHLRNHLRAKLRLAAKKAPHLFGEWANIQDE